MRTIVNYLVITVMLLCFSNKLQAQECTYYFPHKQGTELEMKTYNEKNKVTSVNKSKVLEVQGSNIKVAAEVFDDKEKSIGKSEYTVSCKNGEFVLDMSSYLKGVNMEAYKDMDVKLETEDMHMPANPKPGDVLDDGEMTMKIGNGSMTLMTIKVKVYNRKVEGMESVTTPAGTFDCVKISYDIDSKVGFSTTMKGVEWISKNVGVVKTETYNTKGKMQGYTLLTSIK